MPLANFAAAEAALIPFMPRNHTQRVAYTLEYMQQLMVYLDNPQNKIPAVHVAGTSGKTSTAYYAASLLQAAGKKVGLLTSPHVHQLNERVQINLQPMSERQFCDELAVFMDTVAESGIPVTYAELLYAFAFWEFVRHGVEYMVIEVGLGGLLDATNVIDRTDKACVITDIGLDHTSVLGNTLGEIAQKKAGIIGLHNKVFCYKQAPEIMTQFRATAQKKQADLHAFDRPKALRAAAGLPLFQQRNSYLALQAVQAILYREGAQKLTAAQVAAALQVHIPGRMEVLRHGSQTVVIDGAHNAQKLQMLVASIATMYPARKLAVVLASLDSKSRDSTGLLQALVPLAPHVICAPLPVSDTHASRSVVELQAAASAVGLSYEYATSFEAAVQVLLQRPEPLLVITGSLYMVDAAEKILTAQP